MTDASETEIDLRAWLGAVRRRWWVALASCLIVGGSAFLISTLQSDEYSATASLLFRDPGFDQRLFGEAPLANSDPTREAATNVDLVELDVVADRTAESLEIGSGEVSESVEVEPSDESDVLAITARSPSAERASALANTFAESFVDFRREADQDTIERARELVEREYGALAPDEQLGEVGESLQKQLSRLSTLEALQTGNAEVVQTADVPSSPTSPRPLRNGLIGALAGLVLGIGLALLLERLDRSAKKPEELEEAFEFPLIGSVAESRALRRVGDPGASTNGGGSSAALELDTFQMLRMRLRYFNVDREIKSILVTSAEAGEGKSTVAWYLATAAAATGSSVLLIEADLHRPSFARTHSVRSSPGLSEYLSGQKPLQDVVQAISVSARPNGSSEGRGLAVITAGAEPPNPAELIDSKEIQSLLDQVIGRYDLVVIDTPPAALVPDAIPLMRRVDGVIVVGRLGQLTREHAAQLGTALRRVEAPVLGVVANRVRGRGGRGDGYGYGYGYG